MPRDFDQSELACLIERNADGLLIVDAAGLVRLANPAALELFGRTADALVGHPLGLPLTVGETTSIELLRPTGMLEVEMRVVETIWTGKQALLASLRDISDRRRLEEELRQSQKMEAVGRLTAGVAHDFNNLLTIVLGNLDSMQRRLPEGSDPRLSRSVLNAMEGARRAAELTHQLLAFSRRQPLTPKPLDPGRLVRGMTELLTRTLGSAVRTRIEIDANVSPIIVDASQLESAIINLAVNARDAMDAIGVLTITVRDADDDEYVRISVSDDGTGIAPEVAPHVFEPFFTTKEVGRGTGLGLSQVYGFVTQSAGRVDIESDQGVGTTVNMYLPRHHGAILSGDRAPVRQRTGTGTVLLVEDEQSLRELARGSLEEFGFEVVEACSGPEALELLNSDRSFVLMFTDVNLPGGVDGRDLAELARVTRPGMKVLITTAYAGDALLRDGRLDAGIDLLPKPYFHRELKAALEKLLVERRGEVCVLVVEDDVKVRQTLVETLLDLGVSVHEAETARDAMERIEDQAHPLAAAIIDLGLPDGRGFALFEALKLRQPQASRIVASGYIGESEFGRIVADGEITVLDKPFSGEELSAALFDLGIIQPTARVA